MEEVRIIKQTETPTLIIRMRSDGIVHCTFKENCTLDVEQQVFNLNTYIEITEGKNMPFLFDAREGVWITKEARDNAPMLEDSSPVSATAVVVKTLPYKIFANFYFRFNKPKRPYRVFNNEKSAIKWLKEFC